MSRFATIGCVFVMTLAVMFASASDVRSVPRYVPDMVIVKLQPDVALAVGQAKGRVMTGISSLDQVSARVDAQSLRRAVPHAAPPPYGNDRNGLSQYYIVTLPPGSDVEKAIAEYAADPAVEVAEPNYIEKLTALTPNDPLYGDQWTHYQPSDVDIDTDEAWDLETGDSTIVIGIIDSGVLYQHEDLKWSIWVNPGEDLDGDGVVWDMDDMDSVDNDGNGYVDDLIGYDFLAVGSNCAGGEDCVNQDNDPNDYTGHGTHVSGIAAATTGNGLGVAGIAGGNRAARHPGCKIMAIRAGWLSTDGIGYVSMSACSQGIDYAVANGASVINGSWGSSGTLIVTAAQNAVDAGLTFTYAAGNDGAEIFGAVANVPEVIVVSWLNKFNKKAPLSNYGTRVNISAPGDEIENTYGALGVASYASLSGTSMAAPTVAGVAALIKSHHPWMTRAEIDTIVINNVDDVYADNPPEFAGKLGSGRVNAYKALSTLSTADFTTDTSYGNIPLTVNFTDASPNAPSGPYHYTFGDGNEAFTASAMHTYTDPGIYDVTFTATGPSGPHTRIKPDYIVALADTIEYDDVSLAVTFQTKGSVPVRLHNSHPMKQITLPFRLTGTPNLFIDSLQLGARTAGWTATLVSDNRFAGQIAWRLNPPSGMTLPAADGIVAYLWVRSSSGNTIGEVKTVDSATYSTNYLRLISNVADFKPQFIPGSITMQAACDCPYQCDFDESGALDALDLNDLIDILFFAGTDPQDPVCPATRADFNYDGAPDALDLNDLIDHLFFAGSGPVDPCP